MRGHILNSLVIRLVVFLNANFCIEFSQYILEGNILHLSKLINNQPIKNKSQAVSLALVKRLYPPYIESLNCSNFEQFKIYSPYNFTSLNEFPNIRESRLVIHPSNVL